MIATLEVFGGDHTGLDGFVPLKVGERLKKNAPPPDNAQTRAGRISFQSVKAVCDAVTVGGLRWSDGSIVRDKPHLDSDLSRRGVGIGTGEKQEAIVREPFRIDAAEDCDGVVEMFEYVGKEDVLEGFLQLNCFKERVDYFHRRREVRFGKVCCGWRGLDAGNF